MQGFAGKLKAALAMTCFEMDVSQAKINHRQRNTELTPFPNFHKLSVQRFSLVELVTF